MLAHGTGTTATQNGAKTWYIIYPNYAFGQDMNKNFTEPSTAAGGTVGPPTARRSRTTTSRPSSKAAGRPSRTPSASMQAGADLVNVVKQYNEFKLKDKGSTWRSA